MGKRQNGFTLIEALSAILALSVLMVIGYFVWHKNQSSSQSSSKTSKPTSQINSEKAPNYSGSTVNLKLIGSGSKGQGLISFVVPDGWVADKDSTRSLYFFADDLTYTPGTKFSYSDKANNQDVERFMLSFADASDVPKEYNNYKKSDYGRVNGNTATLYYHQFSRGEHVGSVQMQGGEKEYSYFITKGEDAVWVSYFILAGDKDQTQLIDQVIHTIKF